MLKKFAAAAAVVAVAFVLRVSGGGAIGPFDDAYHLKRITSFPHTIQWDADRAAWCPWPPLYDFAMGAIGPRFVAWIPPIACALFAAFVALRFGFVSGLAIALAPYLIVISRVGAIDHHWIEGIFVAFVAAGFTPPDCSAASARPGGLKPAATTLVMIAALFTQTALVIACGLAFACAYARARREFAMSFALTAAAIVAWRLAVPYPNNPWFLGWPHAALMAAAAVALALHPRWYALPIGGAVTLPFLPQIAEGLSFFRADPWLASIAEFQPMFRDASALGTDFANLGCCLLALAFARKRWPAAMWFAIPYALLALTSRRFLVVAIVVVILAAADRTWIAIALTLLPAIAYDAWAIAHPEPRDETPYAIAAELARLPKGRTLAPWHLGHAIDVFAKKPVVTDNFGSMPDEMRFTVANDALIQIHEDELRSYCARNGIAYLALDHPGHVAAAAQCAGIIDYPRTRLAPRTVWARLWRGESIQGFTRIAPHVWKCSTSTSNPPNRR